MKPLVLHTSLLVALLTVACSGADDPGGSLGGSAGTVANVSGSSSGGTSAGASAAGSSSGGSVAQGGSAAGTGGTGAGTAGSAGSAGSGGVPSSGDRGTDLYAEQCKLCHEDQGKGGVLGPDIQHPIRDYSSWVVRHGRAETKFLKPMEIVPPEKLSDADLALIWDYLDKPPQPTTGEGLYKDYCTNCHGADGLGGPTMRPITMELAKLKDVVRDGTHPGEFDMRREYMSAFPTSRISDAELDLIYAYVDGL